MNDKVRGIQKQIDALQKELSAARREAEPERVSDYKLTAADGSTVMLSELFGGKQDLLVVHNMGKGCPYCTLWADGFNGLSAPLADRCGFALASPDPVDTMRAFGESRGWKFRMVSTKGSAFSRDMGYESPKGEPWPGASGFRKLSDGSIVRTGHASFGPGDFFCAAWHLFDLLKDGAGGWEPKYQYGKS